MENQLKATELRIGNYVYFKNTKDIGKVELIHNNHFDCRDEYGSFIPNGNYEPIQLTEDILVKLGFEKETEDDRYGRVWISKNFGKFIIRRVNFNRPIIEPVRYGFTLEYSDEKDWVGIVNEIATVHQLQNLFFSLCGEELTFKN